MPRMITILAGIILAAGGAGYIHKQNTNSQTTTGTPVVSLSMADTTTGGTHATGVANVDTTAKSTNKNFPQVTSGDYTFSFVTSDKLTRTYLVHIPKNYNPTKSYPVLFGFHGGGGTAAQFEKSSGFSPLADTHGFIAVYGQGTMWGNLQAPVWNGGACCGLAEDQHKNVNDVGYVRDIVKQIEAKYNIDSSRIYTTGMSNGGIFSNRLACEASNIFAGAAIVSGTIQITTCAPAKQIPVLIVHGTADTNVPYYGGKSGGQINATFMPVETEFAEWGKRNGCSGAITTTSIPPLETIDGNTVDKLAFSTGAAAGCVKPVVLYRINGGVHEWPSGNPDANRIGKADPSKALNASQTILDFFKL